METVLIIDTETVNKNAEFGFNANGNLVFDLGVVVWNTDNTIVEQYNAIVKEVWEDPEAMKNYVFSQEKIEWYKQQIALGLLPVKPMSEVAEDMRKLYSKYQSPILAAYNVTFDVRAVKDTAIELKAGLVFDFDGAEVWDIYHMACQALKGNDNFIASCVENGYVTEKGNIKATAESVYSFIHGDYTFVEDHTALSDAVIEADILDWVLKLEDSKKVYFNRDASAAAWRLVQKKK